MLQEQLKHRIEILGWSVATTAKRTGLHRDMISRLLRGKNTDPRLSTMRKLCNGLGVTLDELAGRDNDKA